MVIAQIESLEGVEHAYEIAAVAGIDALFVGPSDLKFDLKAHHSARTYDDCLQKVATAALDHKKPCGILVRTAEDIAKVKALGYTWLAIDSDLALLRDGFVRNVAAAKL